MKRKELETELSSCTYPGRGIILGRSADNRSAVIAYFIMGRSANSRNRIFISTADGIQTKAYDESKMVDPSLIIYAPVRQIGDETIVTNGDQTDTIYDFMKRGCSFEEALLTRTFEPDAPNFTPRISGLVKSNGDFQLSILKSDNGDAACPLRYFYRYENPKAGQGRYIHTYLGDGNPLPSFDGEPTPVTIPNNLETFTDMVWNYLNADNKVALYTCFIDLQTGKHDWKIANKNA